MKPFGHGGNLRQLAQAAGLPECEVLDFSANINPLGPPEWLRLLISSQLSTLTHYPDPDCVALREAVSVRYGVAVDEVIAGNGSTELLYLLPRVLPQRRALILVPAYTDYAHAASQAGMSVCAVQFPVLTADLDRFKQIEIRSAEIRLDPSESAVNADWKLDDSVVFLGRPNNPTGHVLDADALRALAIRNPSSVVVIDEAFGDFVEGFDSLSRRRPANLAVLLSLTKIFAIPGLRLGCAIADAGLVQRLRELQPPWSVNTLAQAVGVAALRDVDYLCRTRRYVREQREKLTAELSALPGLTVFPSQANFLLVTIGNSGIEAHSLAQQLLAGGIAIRVCDNFEGLDATYFRIAVRTAEENARLVEALRSILDPRQHSCEQREIFDFRVSNFDFSADPSYAMSIPAQIANRKSKIRNASATRQAAAIMFQGTSSNAGKSVLAAALCRILRQDGYRVAPFKSQNMSLNSFVTRDGGEMGRAQVVQAQACRIEPDVRMNPILLKPNSDTGSQVILLGKPVANMDVEAYIQFKPQAFEAAKQAFDELAAEYDVVVLEGAGSPAEVNLKHHDIANMQMARHAGAPVLVVGDIDRGGVFASFVGTMEVLAEWERALVAGFIVNRFRGQASLLQDALEYTKRHTGRPVFGVVPFLPDLHLPEEDSVSFKQAHEFPVSSSQFPALTADLDGFKPIKIGSAGICLDPSKSAVKPSAAVDIAVVDLPHISNFTDLDAFRIEPDVRVRVVRSAEELGRPDALILPGSKNVIADLAYLRQCGLAAAIAGLARTEIVGLCGGYQMLGREIADPDGIESSARKTGGLGMLALSTVLEEEKTLRRVSARHCESGLKVHGYEIHHGRTAIPAAPALGALGRGSVPAEQPARRDIVLRDDGEVIGAGSPDRPVWGTYLHGIFDADEFRRWFIDRLRKRRGLPALGKVVAVYDLQEAFDQLAAAVRRSLNMDEIYRLLRLG